MDRVRGSTVDRLHNEQVHLILAVQRNPMARDARENFQRWHGIFGEGAMAGGETGLRMRRSSALLDDLGALEDRGAHRESSKGERGV